MTKKKQNDIVQELIDKTFAELNTPPKPKQRSRVWKSTDGYKFLVQWSNAVLLRILARKVVSSLKSSKTPVNSSNHMGYKLKDRLEAQLLDSCRSVIANIEEGYARPTTSEYLQFLGYSQGSLKEVKGDIERMLQDKLIVSKRNSGLIDLGIDLKGWNDWCKDPGNSSRLLSYPLNKNTGNYRTLEVSGSVSPKTLRDIKGKDLTYEMFIELINKTDYLLRKLVESLERKLNTDQKGYKVEKARIRSNLKVR